MQLILFIIIILMTAQAWSADIHIKDDTYVARGFSKQSDPVMASREACTDARKALIGSVFGEVVQINQNAVKSFGVVNYAEDSHVASEKVQLVGWSQETISESDLTTCILKYPTNEAMIEKQRLKGSQSQSGIQYSEIGEGQDDKSGSLEVVSYPANAAVYIDHERWGTTPVRLKNKLTAGEHILRIELNNFEPIEESIQIRAGIRTQVVRNFTRSRGTLKIETTPSDAEVLVNDQLWGRSPIEKQVLSGQSLRIQILHPQAEAYFQTLEIARNEVRKLDLKLSLKPAYVSFQVDPSQGVSAFLDGAPVQVWTQIKTEPGHHVLKIKKEGYREETINFIAEGNKTKVLRTIELHKLTNSEERLEAQAERSKFPPLILSYGAGIFSSEISGVDKKYFTQGTTLSAVYRFSKSLGVGISHSHSEGVVSFNFGKINVVQSRSSLNVPITLYTTNESEYIFDFGISQVSTVFSVNGSQSTVVLNKQQGDFYFRWRKWLTQGLIPIGAVLSYGSSMDSNWQAGLDLCLGF